MTAFGALKTKMFDELLPMRKINKQYTNGILPEEHVPAEEQPSRLDPGIIDLLKVNKKNNLSSTMPL